MVVVQWIATAVEYGAELSHMPVKVASLRVLRVLKILKSTPFFSDIDAILHTFSESLAQVRATLALSNSSQTALKQLSNGSQTALRQLPNSFQTALKQLSNSFQTALACAVRRWVRWRRWRVSRSAGRLAAAVGCA